MSVPSVYQAINAISAELAKSGIPKRHVNEVDEYRYRSIDDLIGKLAPLLAAHRLCVLPRVLEREVSERRDDADHILVSVALRVSYALTSAEDGSSHVVEVYGEALDAGDKATAKALSAAYKSAMVRTFCVSSPDADDPDRATHKLKRQVHQSEPVQGWTQWCVDFQDIISLCESEPALSTVQERNRDLLKALGREQPQLYAEIGQAFTDRRDTILDRVPPPAKGRRSPSAQRVSKRNGSRSLEGEHA